MRSDAFAFRNAGMSIDRIRCVKAFERTAALLSIRVEPRDGRLCTSIAFLCTFIAQCYGQLVTQH